MDEEMKVPLWQGWLGSPVKVWMGRGARNGLRGFYFGILDDFDEFAIFIRQPDGETVFLPLESLTRIEPFDPDSSKPEGSLLRAASNPANTGGLLLPASDNARHADKALLRPADTDKTT